MATAFVPSATSAITNQNTTWVKRYPPGTRSRIEPSEYGIGFEATNPLAIGLPSMVISGFPTLGDPQQPFVERVNNVFQFSDDFTYLTGRHSMKFGVDIRREYMKIAFINRPNGDMFFNGAISGNAFSGTRLEIFIGSGPSKLAGGAINPKAIGILIRNASVAFAKGDNAADGWALRATGTLAFLGLDGLSITGTVSFQVSTSGTMSFTLADMGGMTGAVAPGAFSFTATGVVISADGNPQRAASVDAAGYLAKPFDIDALLSQVAQMTSSEASA